MKLSDRQRLCIIHATIDNLRPFRRGYARSKEGPFFDTRTIEILLREGALRKVKFSSLGLVSARSE